MKYPKHINALVFVLALMLAGCRRAEPVPGGVDAIGTGSLSLHFCPAMPATKAPVAEDGDAFTNVLVVITNNALQVIDSQYKEYLSPVSEDVVSFVDLKVGTYQVFAYANIDHEAWQTEQTVALTEKMLEGSRNGGEVLSVDRLLRSLGDANAPDAPAVPMLLTGHRELSVGSNENVGEVELLRPVSRLNVYLSNHTDYPISLTELGFTRFNPSDAYLLSHWSAGGKPELPAGNSYRDLPAFTGPVAVAAESDALVYSTLLYENAANREYRMFAGLTLDYRDALGQPMPVTRELEQTGPKLLTHAEIADMQPGESRQVLLLNPNTSSGGFFGLDGRTTVKTDASYNVLESYEVKASRILESAADRARYVLTLTRQADGRYMLGNATNGFAHDAGMDYNPYVISEGFVPAVSASGGWPVPKGFEGRLSLLGIPNWANNYLQNNGSSVATAHVSGELQGRHMWAFYEVDPKGSPLRLIDKETAQVTPLRWMRRNQELNVVMNIYLEEENHQFRFEVDNAYWTEGHNMTHIYR